MTVAILVIGLLALAVIFGWAAWKVRSLAMAVVLQMGCFIFLAPPGYRDWETDRKSVV